MVQPMMSDEIFLVKKRFSHLLHFEFMEQPMMFVEFPFRQKTFLAFTALLVHGISHSVWLILFRQKTFLTFYAWCSTWCFVTFFRKTFSHIFHKLQHMNFLKLIILSSLKIWSENIKHVRIFIVITTAVQSLLPHWPRMRSNRASAAHVQ